jgi:hypothetical protein
MSFFGGHKKRGYLGATGKRKTTLIISSNIMGDEESYW